jgi:hypothetical protein
VVLGLQADGDLYLRHRGPELPHLAGLEQVVRQAGLLEVEGVLDVHVHPLVHHLPAEDGVPEPATAPLGVPFQNLGGLLLECQPALGARADLVRVEAHRAKLRQVVIGRPLQHHPVQQVVGLRDECGVGVLAHTFPDAVAGVRAGRDVADAQVHHATERPGERGT